jgi:hypothetical protein
VQSPVSALFFQELSVTLRVTDVHISCGPGGSLWRRRRAVRDIRISVTLSNDSLSRAESRSQGHRFRHRFFGASYAGSTSCWTLTRLGWINVCVID